MRKNVGVKNWMFPMPVLMIGTYNEDGTTKHDERRMGRDYTGRRDNNLHRHIASVLTDGKPDAAKMKPICFDPCQHVYRLMGEVVAKAFSCGKKELM